MKHRALLALGIAAAFAAVPVRAAEISYELDTNVSYVGGADSRLGWHRRGSVSEESGLFRFVVSPQIKQGLLLRIGAEWQRTSFDLPSGSLLPNTLQSVNLVLGLDAQVGESWLLRMEAMPGIYGDNSLRGSDFDVPFVIGGSYLANPDLQWIFGVAVNVNGQYPVLPGAGVRWKFADRWVLNAILPTPRLEYEFSKSLTAWAGFDFRSGTYRVSPGFGTARFQPRLNGSVLEYMEFRTGVGATWKVSHNWTLEAETGYVPYRKFDYFRAGPNLDTRSGAPYGQLSIGARF